MLWFFWKLPIIYIKSQTSKKLSLGERQYKEYCYHVVSPSNARQNLEGDT